MSKADAQRAMREAKYARIRASGPTRREAAVQDGTAAVPAAPTPSAAKAPATPRTRSTAKAGPAAEAAEVAAAPDAAAEAPRCGHTSMNGRSCTREVGHAEKNHRYG